MLEHPLQQAYLVSGDPKLCIPEIRQQLQELYAERTETLHIDPVIADKFLVEDAHELSRRGRQQGAGEVWCLMRGFFRTNKEAQNAVLKILEEPAEGTHFFFVTPSAGELLETVRSRMAREDLCAHTSGQNKHAEKFLTADSLPDRLSVSEDVVADDALRQFVSGLKKAIENNRKDHHQLQQALVMVATWLDDVGRSDKQIAEFLALAAEQDSTDK